MVDIDQALVKIIYEELGKKSSDLFINFYHDFPRSEQVQGAKEILTLTVGEPRTEQLLKEVFKRNENT